MKTLTPEHRAKIAAALKGRTFNDDRLEKMHAACRGKKLSDEHKAKLSAARAGRKLSRDHVEKIASANRGRTHTAECRARMSQAAKMRVRTPAEIERFIRGNPHRGKPLPEATKQKIRAVALGREARFAKPVVWNGTRFRSTWEVRVASALTDLGVEWLYEPRSFILSDGSRYTPDFYLPDDHAYWEVKGWFSATAVRKIRAFRSEYAETPLVVIDKAAMESVEAAAEHTR